MAYIFHFLSCRAVRPHFLSVKPEPSQWTFHQLHLLPYWLSLACRLCSDYLFQEPSQESLHRPFSDFLIFGTASFIIYLRLYIYCNNINITGIDTTESIWDIIVIDAPVFVSPPYVAG